MKKGAGGMAGGRDYSSYQKGIINRYYEHRDTIVLQRLGEIVSDLYLSENPRKANTLWKNALAALKKTGANPVHVDNVIARRDVEQLAQLVNELTIDPGKASDAPPPAAAAPLEAPTPRAAVESASTEVTAAELKGALRAFRKRLKLTRLDDESKLGHGPMSSGHHSQVESIIPPDQYPKRVWDELVKQGKLRYTGNGFYQLLE